MDAPKKATKLGLVYPDIEVRVHRIFTDMKDHHGLDMVVTEGLRSFKYQDDLYKIGRFGDTRKTVTNAKPGDSLHHYGFAVDCCFKTGDPYLQSNVEGDFLWSEFGRFANVHGMVWGGDFRNIVDKPHIQNTYGFALHEVKEMYQEDGLWGLWSMIDFHRHVKRGDIWDEYSWGKRIIEATQFIG